VAENRVPHSWVGQQVEALIIHATYSGQFGLPTGLTASYTIGTLEAVNELGMLASLVFDPEDEEEEPVSMFYPWSAVLWLRLAEEE
jgi:hypothetical protein